jgi:hypothetical protein
MRVLAKNVVVLVYADNNTVSVVPICLAHEGIAGRASGLKKTEQSIRLASTVLVGGTRYVLA